MKITYKPKEKAKLISGMIVYINYVLIFDGYIQYNIWDGKDRFLNVDEWQLIPFDKTPIGFNIE